MIGNGVTAIGNSAFDGCESLVDLTLGSSVRSIGTRAFYGCSSLAEITLPSSVISIGSQAFYECTSLKEVFFENEYGWFCNEYADSTGGEEISSTDLSDRSIAATYLTTTYYKYYWKR